MMMTTSFELIERIFLTVFPVFIIVLGGYLYGRNKSANIDFANQANMDLFVPALIFHSLANQAFPISQYLNLALGGVLVVLGSGLLVYPLLKYFKIDVRTFLPPMMFNNSGNMGIPLLVLAFGEAALPAAVILFIIENTLHMSVGIYILERSFHPLKMLRMPMVWSAIAGLIWSLAEWQLPEALALPIKMLGQIAIPLMLFTLGIRIAQVGLNHWREGVLGAVLCPLSGVIIALACYPWLGLSDQQFGLLLVFGALPPAVLNYMIAERYNQEPHRVASIVLIGNMGSLIIIPIVLAFVL